MYTVELYLFFEDCQNFAGSWGRNFLGNWFEALQCRTIHYFVKHSWEPDVNSWVRENQKIHEHQTPTNNDSTVPLPHHSGTKQQFTTEIFTNLNQHFQLKNTCF